MSSWRQKRCSGFLGGQRKCLLLTLYSSPNPLYTCHQRCQNFVHGILTCPLLCLPFKIQRESCWNGLEKACIRSIWSIATCLQRCFQIMRPLCQWTYLKCWETDFFFCSGKQWLLHCSPNNNLPHSCSNTKQFLCSFSLFSGLSVSIPSSINLVLTFKVSRGAKREHTGPRSC